MISFGIDVGKKGGFCLMIEGQIEYVRPMPVIGNELSIHVIDAIISAVPDSAHVFIEKVSSMPGQGVVSMFSFGRCLGIIEGIVASNGHRQSFVRPQEWQKEIFKGETREANTKLTALKVAKRLFPKESFLATSRSVKPHDGMVDAALIAYYGHLMYGRKRD